MIKIKHDDLEMDGEMGELLAEISSVIVTLHEMDDDNKIIPMLLSGYYMCLQTKNRMTMIEALKMFKEDTQKALTLIEAYTKMEGNTLEEKYENMKSKEEDDE